MKSQGFFLLALFIPFTLLAQHAVPIRNLWTRAQVHVMFGGYKVSFAIRDINKAVLMLNDSGDTIYGTSCGLDTGKNYFYELYPGTHTEYREPMQPLLQNGVGVYLLSIGKAVVENDRHKILKDIIADFAAIEDGAPFTFVSFYDPHTHEMLFSGRIDTQLIGRDIGLDD